MLHTGASQSETQQVLLLAQDGEMDAVQLGAHSLPYCSRHVESMQALDPIRVSRLSCDKVLTARASHPTD